MAWAIVVVALSGLGFAGVAVALGVRVGSLKAICARLATRLNDSERERGVTRAELDGFRSRTKEQLEGLRNEITDLEDNLDACTDPIVLRGHLDRLLQKASSRDSGPRPGKLP